MKERCSGPPPGELRLVAGVRVDQLNFAWAQVAAGCSPCSASDRLLMDDTLHLPPPSPPQPRRPRRRRTAASARPSSAPAPTRSAPARSAASTARSARRPTTIGRAAMARRRRTALSSLRVHEYRVFVLFRYPLPFGGRRGRGASTFDGTVHRIQLRSSRPRRRTAQSKSWVFGSGPEGERI